MKGPDTVITSRAALLDEWANAKWQDGCQVDELPEFQALTVITRNTLYHVVVMSGRDGAVRVRGGQFFPDWTDATLAGCSLGGSFLKLRGIYVGFCMELHVDGGAIVTSPVQRIAQQQQETAVPH
jgi:hypothetical protein